MPYVSMPGMHTFCVMFGRADEGWHFAALDCQREVVRISGQLSDDDVAAITADRATWPVWNAWEWALWARKRKWSIVSVVGASCDIGNPAVT